MTSRSLVLSALAAVALLGSPAAFAKKAHTWACADAVKEFCGDVQPGGNRILQCLKGHESQLSPACVTASQKAEEHHQAFEAACTSDITSLCKDQDTGHGHLWKCLKGHESQLSAPCQAFTAKAHHEMAPAE